MLAEAQGTSFMIHLELWKTGDAWSFDLHTHEPAPLADRTTASYEPFTIVVNTRGRGELIRVAAVRLVTELDALGDRAASTHERELGGARAAEVFHTPATVSASQTRVQVVPFWYDSACEHRGRRK